MSARHWARVWTNGFKVAEVNGADQEIVKLFALFHDSRRVNEYTDPGHGERGGNFARELRGTLVHLDDDRFELLPGNGYGDWTLRFRLIRESDAGKYECQISTSPKLSQTFTLNVIGK